MYSNVTLIREKRSHKGESYEYWFLRWIDSGGRRRKQSLGRTDKISKRQADKKRQAKQIELDSSPGRRNFTRAPELGAYLEGYFEARKTELSGGTMELHRQTGRYLIAFFGEGRLIDSITRSEARSFKTALANGDLAHVNKRKRQKTPAVTTVDRIIREARTIFEMAVTDEAILTNPFAKLGTGKYVEKEWHYVDAEDFAKLMSAAKPEWRLMLGLARWAGLRAEEALELP